MTPQELSDHLFSRFRAVMNKFCLDSDVKSVAKVCLEEMSKADPANSKYYKSAVEALFENKVKSKSK